MRHPACERLRIRGSGLRRGVAWFVTLAPGASLSNEEVPIYCRRKLPPFEAPNSVMLVDELPKNARGRSTAGRWSTSGDPSGVVAGLRGGSEAAPAKETTSSHMAATPKIDDIELKAIGAVIGDTSTV